MRANVIFIDEAEATYDFVGYDIKDGCLILHDSRMVNPNGSISVDWPEGLRLLPLTTINYAVIYNGPEE